MLCKRCYRLNVITEASVLVREFYKGKYKTEALLCADCLSQFKKEAIPDNLKHGYSYKILKVRERVSFT